MERQNTRREPSVKFDAGLIAALTKLHECAAVGSEDNAHPVERVGGLRGLHAVDRDLAAHQEDEQGDDRP